MKRHRFATVLGSAVLGLAAALILIAACPAAEEAAAQPEEELVLEPAVNEAETPPPPATPEEAAARAEAEHKEKREKERKEILKEAEEFVATADEKIIQNLPSPLAYLFGATFFGIPLWRYAAGAGLFVGGILLISIMLFWLRRIKRKVEAEETEQGWRLGFDVALMTLRNPIKFIIPGIFLRSVSNLLVTSYHPDIVWISNLLVFLGIALYFFDLVGVVDKAYGARIFRSSDRLMDTVRPILLKMIRLLILVIAFMHVYQGITGQTMVSVLAGLGIGGLALALASQETLQNLLGFASIALDKAFLVGDPVSIANYDGIVEHVGLRSMRIRAYNGNSVIIPNSTAINSNIVNLNRRPYIRREIRISLSPQNSYEKVSEAIDLIREALDTHEGKLAGLPPVVRFIDYEPARFVIQALFWYDAEKPFYFDECSKVNLEICRRLSAAGVLYAER